MIDFFKEILSIDSTTGNERALSEWLVSKFVSKDMAGAVLQRFEVGDGTENLLLSWGEPKVVLCTHLDTVPPYIPPTVGDGIVYGRGACDAKGQIVSMLEACIRLSEEGQTGFGLLLLSGEETGSFGAKAFAKLLFRAPILVVGEPTDGKPVSASKGTKSYDLTFHGVPFHSGYPQYGVSAVDLFATFASRLKAVKFREDPLLGDTTWNIGLVHSDNPQNILSPELTCRIYFRTTFLSDAHIPEVLDVISAQAVDMVLHHCGGCGGGSCGGGCGEKGTGEGHCGDGGHEVDETSNGDVRIDISPRGGDSPAEYFVPEGFEGAPAAFGSDAPHLTNFERKIICGPGSIRHAHRDDEQISLAELEAAVETYIRIFKTVS